MPIVVEEHFNLSEERYSNFIRSHHASVLQHCKFHAGMGVVGPVTSTQHWRWSVVSVTNEIGRSIEIVKSLESLWLYGYRCKPNDENRSNNPWRVITDEEEGFSGLPGDIKSLNFDGKYPSYTPELNVSKFALQNAITTLDEYAKELNKGARKVNYNKARKAFVMIILYFAEALRIIPIRDVLQNGFDNNHDRVFVEEKYIDLAQDWSIKSHAFLSGGYLGEDLWLVLHKKGTRSRPYQLDGVPPDSAEDPENEDGA